MQLFHPLIKYCPLKKTNNIEFIKFIKIVWFLFVPNLWSLTCKLAYPIGFIIQFKQLFRFLTTARQLWKSLYHCNSGEKFQRKYCRGSTNSMVLAGTNSTIASTVNYFSGLHTKSQLCLTCFNSLCKCELKKTKIKLIWGARYPFMIAECDINQGFSTTKVIHLLSLWKLA